jgi:rSAM/selenodomain-associated transferase 1
VDKSVENVDKPSRTAEKISVLGIYAKQPLPGQVKTRLCPPLSPLQAAGLYHCALQETVARMREHGTFELVLCYAGERSWFEGAFPSVRLLPQRGADLGARMADSFASLLGQGYRQAVLIGSDAPDLPLPLVEEAFRQLRQVEVVLAPAADGGYVLIGKAVSRPELFEAIRWSSPEVLPETLRRITDFGLKARLLPGWEDLDDLAALGRLLQRSPHSRTAGYLRRELAEHFPKRRQT